MAENIFIGAGCIIIADCIFIILSAFGVFDKLVNPHSEEEMLAEKKEREEELEDDRKAMLSTYCPIYKADCSSNCVHFYHGRVYQLSDRFFYYPPRCKLWDKRG